MTAVLPGRGSIPVGIGGVSAVEGLAGLESQPLDGLVAESGHRSQVLGGWPM